MTRPLWVCALCCIVAVGDVFAQSDAPPAETTAVERPLDAGDAQPYAGAAQLSAGGAGTLTPHGRVFVTDRNGVETAGRFLRVSADELTLLINGEERALPLRSLGRIERRDRLWNGILIGAVPSAILGMAAAGASCSPHCGRDMGLGALTAGALGAGIGGLIDFGVHGYAIVDGPSLPSANALKAPLPVRSLDELWLRVRQGDTIEVVTGNGQTVTGTFIKASTTALTLDTNRSIRDIQAGDVRRVRRPGNRYRAGALWGGVIFATLGLVSSASCNDCGGDAAFAAVLMGTTGALWGTAIGAMIPRHPTVYERSASATTRVEPLVTPNGVGLGFSVRF